MIEYEIRVDTEGDLTLRFQAVKGRLGGRIETAMLRAATEAATYMTAHVPYHTGQLYRAINVSAEKGGQGLKYFPGGAGGGGFYEIHVGVDREMAPHADWVIHGTGIYGPRGSLIYGRPKDNRGGNRTMVFEKNGEQTVFTRYTEGQKAQTSWFTVAEEVMSQSIRRQLSRLRT